MAASTYTAAPHRLTVQISTTSVDANLEEALARHGRPEIFNTDQGSQFTSEAFTGLLKHHGIAISMDGKSLPPRRRGAGAWTTSSSSGCGAVSNTRRSCAVEVWPRHEV